MIQANDIRVGNYLIDQTGVANIVKSIGVGWVKFIDDEACAFDLCRPVPITTQWLKDFGLKERYVKGEWSWANCDPDKTWDSYTELRERDGGLKYLADYPLIKNVHELQNLYHALTREELVK